MPNKLAVLIMLALGSLCAQQAKTSDPKSPQSEFQKEMTPIKSTLEFYIGLAKDALADVDKKKLTLDKEMANRESPEFAIAAARFARSCQIYFDIMAEVSLRGFNFSRALAKQYALYEKGVVNFDIQEADDMLALVESEVSDSRSKICQEIMPKLRPPQKK
jgi:hypothetical protein